MSHTSWKADWEVSRARYLEWWAGRGLVISMWEHLEVDGICHEDVPRRCPGARPRPAVVRRRVARSRHPLPALAQRAAGRHPAGGQHAARPGLAGGRPRGRAGGGEDTIWIEAVGARCAGRVRSDRALAAHAPRHRARLPAALRWPLLRGLPRPHGGLDTLAGLRGVAPVMGQIVHGPRAARAGSAGGQRRLVRCLRPHLRSHQRGRRDGLLLLLAVVAGPHGQAAVRRLGDDLAEPLPPSSSSPSSPSSAAGWTTLCITSTACRPSTTSMRCWRSRSSTRSSGRRAWASPRAGTPPGSTSTARSARPASRSWPRWVETDELEPLLDAVGPEGMHVLMDFRSPARHRRRAGDRGATIDDVDPSTRTPPAHRSARRLARGRRPGLTIRLDHGLLSLDAGDGRTIRVRYTLEDTSAASRA